MKLINDAKIAKAVILSPDFATYSMADRYRELSHRAGIDFSAAIKLLEYLPVFIDGENHQRIRKVMAKQISRTKDSQLSAARQRLGDLFQGSFHPGAEIDLVADFAQHLWRSIVASIVSENEGLLDLVDEIPELFSPLLSIRERAKINAKIEAFLQSNSGADDEDERLINLCLGSLGARPFVGTLSLSLYDIFRSHPNSRMCGFTWPQSFPSSSLTYVDRMCTGAGDYSGLSVKEGDRVRCITQSSSYSGEENSRALFGFGAHTCLGKSISERVWSLVAETLSKSELRAECLSITMSPHNDPFLMPATIKIRLH
ncbi:hypothetical protein [Hyphomicrobium sp. 99]|uniref:hypothetical protein n=1 Tax=Hyphomicrobium sp. 99 TaxID=1163419 RepID=UPI0005F79FB4|nr:hypothetical protein [Hyphomicrobium sp. 99]